MCIIHEWRGWEIVQRAPALVVDYGQKPDCIYAADGRTVVNYFYKYKEVMPEPTQQENRCLKCGLFIRRGL